MTCIELFANLKKVGLSCLYSKLFVINGKVFYSEGIEAWGWQITRLPIAIPPNQIMSAMDAKMTRLRMAESLLMISACANTSKIFNKL